jgi:hypothetical protein
MALYIISKLPNAILHSISSFFSSIGMPIVDVILYSVTMPYTQGLPRIRIRAGSQKPGDTFMPADYIKLSMNLSFGPKRAE